MSNKEDVFALLEQYGVRGQYEALLASVETVVPFQQGSICADGGYGINVATTSGRSLRVAGMPAGLGEDMGLVLAAAASKKASRDPRRFDPQQFTEAAIEAALKSVGSFHLHTSTETHGNFCDCGHCVVCASNPESGLTKEEVVTMVQTAQKIALRHPNVHDKVLDREHSERDVVINMGSQVTLPHWITPESHPELSEFAFGQQFVVDPVKAQERVIAILGGMGLKDGGIQQVMEQKAAHDKGTLGALAEGKPVFKVDFDNPQMPVVEFIGLVKPDGNIRF